MKLKHLITTFALAGVLGLGVAAGFAGVQEKPVEEAKAASTTIYVDLSNCTGSGDWTEANAVTKLRLFSTGNPLIDLQETSTSGLYTCDADISSGCQIVRVDPDNQSYIWSYGSDNKSNFNFVKVSGYSTDWSFVNHIENGNIIYMDIRDTYSWWHLDYSTYLYAVGPRGYKVLLGHRQLDTNMYKFTYDSEAFINKFLFVRGSGFDGTNWAKPYCENQSVDIGYTTSNTLHNGIKLGPQGEYGEDKDKLMCTGMESFSDAYVADSFGYQFMHLNICLEDGLHDDAPTSWATLDSSYTSLKSLLTNKDYIKNTVRNISGNNIEQAMARYDNVVYKRGYDDFILRNPTTPSSRTYVDEVAASSTNTTAIIVIISALALTAVGGYFLLRRKED